MKKFLPLFLVLVSCWSPFGPKDYETDSSVTEKVETWQGDITVTIDYVEPTKKVYGTKDFARLVSFYLQVNRHLGHGQTPDVLECMNNILVIVVPEDQYYRQDFCPQGTDGCMGYAKWWRFDTGPETDHVIVLKKSIYEAKDVGLFIHELGHVYAYCKWTPGNADPNHTSEEVWYSYGDRAAMTYVKRMEDAYLGR